jgi:hypothetical protein
MAGSGLVGIIDSLPISMSGILFQRKKREVWVPDNGDVEEPVDFSHLFSDVKKNE